MPRWSVRPENGWNCPIPFTRFSEGLSLSWPEGKPSIPDDQVVTTQRAADILGVSRPFFIKLLDTGAMGYHRVGNQRRVYLRDVLSYAQKREKQRRAALARLSQAAVGQGLYDRSVIPEGGQDE